jgi:hypothetical protein
MAGLDTLFLLCFPKGRPSRTGKVISSTAMWPLLCLQLQIMVGGVPPLPFLLPIPNLELVCWSLPLSLPLQTAQQAEGTQKNSCPTRL